MIHFLCNGKQQIVADGNPNLRENRIPARTIERLDMQPLLYPFEETFHLPAFPIEFCDSQVGVGEVVGQESIDIACSIIFINPNRSLEKHSFFLSCFYYFFYSKN